MGSLTVNRDELKIFYKELIEYIQGKHVMGPEIEKELYINNTPVVGLCHQRAYFILFGPFHCRYLMDHIITDVSKRIIGRSLRQVTFYDTYTEYESVRMKEMGAKKNNEQTGINLN